MKISEEARNFAEKAVTDWNQDRIAVEAQQLFDTINRQNKTIEELTMELAAAHGYKLNCQKP